MPKWCHSSWLNKFIQDVHTCMSNIGVYNDSFFDAAVVFLQTLKQECTSLKSSLDKSKAETLEMKLEAKVCTYFYSKICMCTEWIHTYSTYVCNVVV